MRRTAAGLFQSFKSRVVEAEEMASRSSHKLRSMARLQNRWYAALISALGQEPATFQIQQPAFQIIPTDEAMWSYMNRLPSGLQPFENEICCSNLFFHEYAATVGQFPPLKSTLERDIGKAAYEKWVNYLAEVTPAPAENDYPQLFRAWAMKQAPQAAVAGASGLLRDILGKAFLKQLTPYEGLNARQPDFVGTFADLMQALTKGTGLNLGVIDNAHETEGDPSAWIQNSDPLYGLYTGSCGDQRLTRRFAESEVTVSVEFGAVATWSVTPGDWYNSSILHTALVNKGSPPWPKDANPTWDDVFGPQGSLRTFKAALFVVDRINSTITSNMIFNDRDRQLIRSEAANGFWPFYIPTTDHTAINSVTFNAHGMAVTTTTQSERPFVIGNFVLDAARYLGGRG